MLIESCFVTGAGKWSADEIPQKIDKLKQSWQTARNCSTPVMRGNLGKINQSKAEVSQLPPMRIYWKENPTKKREKLKKH